MRNKAGRFVKGFRPSIKTEFQKGQRPHNWNGGRYKNKRLGYIFTKCEGHPRAYKGYVYEHILVAEKKLGRYLSKDERVHHINRIKDDNRPENIIVFGSNIAHIRYHGETNPWSRTHSECAECGTIKTKHGGYGLCENCYKRKKYRGKL